jgi:hypothetical protein
LRQFIELVKCKSCLMQDEPGAGVGFSHKMSLERE